jgi:hypothetical protein
MTDKKPNMYQLEQNLLRDLNDNKNQILKVEYVEDLLSEYAESNVPVYNFDLLMLAADDLYLGYPNEYIVPGENSYNAYEIIKWNVYEKLLNVANDWLSKQLEEAA